MSDSVNMPLVSIVVPCYNEEAAFPPLQSALINLADHLEPDCRCEFVFVDDGSRDGTWELIKEFSKTDARVRGVSLSRNFGHQRALTCGYDVASGDAIVCMDADLQDPPETIIEMIKRWQEGADIVYGVRESRQGESPFKLLTAKYFYRLINALGASYIRQDSGDFRLMSRRSLDALQSMPESHRFIRGMVGWIGFKTDEVTYKRMPRSAGETKYPLKKMVLFAMDALVSFSSFPLRLAYIMAFLLSLIFLGYLGSNLVQWLVYGKEMVPGWSSLILSTIAFGAMNLLCLGLIGEYVGRIYEQSKDRPIYLIDKLTGSEQSAIPPDGMRSKLDLEKKGIRHE